jgi:hypothetical protein
MPASFPSGFDTMSRPGSNLSGPPLHSTQHNQICDVIEAIEAELGIAPSGADATVAATLAALSSRYVPLAGGVILTDAAQTFTSAVAGDITWSTEISDPDGWTAGGIATLTIPAGKAGRYLTTLQGFFSAVAPGLVYGVLNGSAAFSSPIDNVSGLMTLSFLHTFVVGDTIKFQVYQTSGSNKDVTSRLEICPV